MRVQSPNNWTVREFLHRIFFERPGCLALYLGLGGTQKIITVVSKVCRLREQFPVGVLSGQVILKEGRTQRFWWRVLDVGER